MLKPEKSIPWILAAVVCVVLAAPAPAGETIDAEDVFEQLKSLAGTWVGHAKGQDETTGESVDAMGAKHVFEVSAAGTVVMETMGPGTDHEMINMYHLDGEELVLTHYCAGGNQPVMKLDRSHSGGLKFDFTGGTNLDPASDPHIHGALIEVIDADNLVSTWNSYMSGKPAGGMVFSLSRQK